jgi:lipopolysaccharide exporter
MRRRPLARVGPDAGAAGVSATRSLARAAVSGVAWQGAAYLVGRGLTLAATVVLARLLAPEDFGVVAIALVFLTFAESAADLGIAQALVYFPRDPRRSDAALAVCLLSALALAVTGVLAAPLVADFFNRPDVAPMFRVLSLSLLLVALRQVPDALLRRELRFGRRAVAEASRALVQGGVSIVLALGGLGAWALVWGYLAGNLTWCLATWALAGYRPSVYFWRPRRATTGPLLRYGMPAAGQGLLAALIFDVDYLVVGHFLGAEALGLYTLAFRLPQMLVINVFFLISAVAFPIFSRARDDPERLRSGYLRSLRLEAAYGVGAGVALAVSAPMLVPVLFGPGWEGSVAPLQALGVYATFRALGFGAVDVYKAIGRPGLAAAVSLARLIVLVPALIAATHFGIEGVAWAQAALALGFAVLMQGVACRILQLPVRELWSAARPALAVALGVTAGIGAVRLALPGPDALRLAVAVPAAAVGALALLWTTDRRFISEILALIPGHRRLPEPASA